MNRTTKNLVCLGVLLAGISATPAKAEYGRRCGMDQTNKALVCFRDFPTFALEITDHSQSGKQEFAISMKNISSVYTDDGRKDYYLFENGGPGNFFMFQSRIVVPGGYPGDGESEFVRMEAVSPNGQTYVVTKLYSTDDPKDEMSNH